MVEHGQMSPGKHLLGGPAQVHASILLCLSWVGSAQCPDRLQSHFPVILMQSLWLLFNAAPVFRNHFVLGSFITAFCFGYCFQFSL